MNDNGTITKAEQRKREDPDPNPPSLAHITMGLV